MIRFVNLTAEEQTRIDAKLAELKQKSGHLWTCEVTRKPDSTDGDRFLEIAIEGKILKPVMLNPKEACSGERICRELDLAYENHHQN